MKGKILGKIKLWVRSLVALGLAALVIFGHAAPALARRGGGRIGGGSFRMPTRSIPAPRSNGNYGGNYSSPSYYGGGFGGGSFFFLPMLFGGGGSLFGLLVMVAIAGVVLQAFRSRGESGQSEGITGLDSKVTLVKLKVGLLSSARQLQNDFTRLAQESDTGSSSGLALLLRESTVSLLRHPEYWVYVSSGKEVTRFDQAEQKFNSLAMSERSKLNAEVISNVNNRQINSAKSSSSLPSTAELIHEDPSEYVVATLLVAIAGDNLKDISTVRSASELKQALSSIGAIPEDKLLALEILWEPQSEDYTLTSDEVISIYPELIRI
jgi:uncharacterized membrane protein